MHTRTVDMYIPVHHHIHIVFFFLLSGTGSRRKGFEMIKSNRMSISGSDIYSDQIVIFIRTERLYP